MTALLSAGLGRDFLLGRRGAPHIGEVSTGGDPLLCIAAGERASVAIHVNGFVSVWGNNSDFDTGVGPTTLITQVLRLSPGDLGFIPVWACAQGRRTVFLSSEGVVYIGCSDFKSAGRIGRISLDRRVVAIATGPAESYAIDTGGRIIRIMTAPAQTFTLPDGPAVLIAAGSGFAIAASKSGVCYGFGRLSSSGDGFSAVSGLDHVSVTAVYANGDRFAVLTDKSRVLHCSFNSDGRRGGFGPVVIPENVSIVDVALGPGFALLLSSDGRVLAWGNNINEQLFLVRPSEVDRPVIVDELSGIGAIAVGAQHSLAYRGPRLARATAPGKCGPTFFSCQAVSDLGFRIGDIVRAEGRVGFVLNGGRCGVSVADGDGVRSVAPASVEWLSARGYVGVEHGGRLLDGGRALYRAFGLRSGEILAGPHGLVAVVGMRGAVLVLRDQRGRELAFGGTAVEFSRTFSLASTWRNVETRPVGCISLPVESVGKFFGRFRKGIIRVVGRWAAWFVGDDGSGALALYGDTQVFPLAQGEGDRVECAAGRATVVAVVDKTAVVLVDGARECQAVPIAEIEWVASFGGGEGPVAVSAVEAENAAVLPGDLWLGKEGFVTIQGFSGGKVVGAGGGEVDVGELVLVRRELAWGRREAKVVAAGDMVEVSRFAADIARTGLRQADEVVVGGRKGIVLGTDGVFVWMLEEGGELFAVDERLEDDKVTVVKRPTENTKLLFECLAASPRV